MPTVYMMGENGTAAENAKEPSSTSGPTVGLSKRSIKTTSGAKGRSIKGGNMESFIDPDELARLSESELSLLRKSVEDGEIINRSFKRSKYYPFPRDLCFPQTCEREECNASVLPDFGL